ncbi:hypothetical protein IXEL_42 [Microbacterium phage Ixel]|nr:hypothetical protein IXEL_42 [Microbacterium phage Ixel]
MNIRKITGGVVAALLAVGGLALTAAPASATEVCVPSAAVPAWTEVVPDIEHPAVYETVVVTPAVEASTKWWNFSPNKDQGPLEGAPTFPEDERGTWQGPHTEGGPGQDQTGVYQQGNGHGSWFYRENTPATPEVTEERLVTEAYTEVVPDIEHPAIPEVTCPGNEEPPTEYVPTCTTVSGHQTITGDGVLSVAGGWDTTSLNVPFNGTLADIGTVLNIDASPLQYVGLHITTPEGTIVFEEEPSYGGKLWSNSTFDGVNPGMGYPAFGTIEEFIRLNGNLSASVTLLYTHSEASSTTVESFTIGCQVYTFEPEVEEPPVEEPPVEEPPVVQPPAPQQPAPVAAQAQVAPTPVVAERLAETGSEASPLPWVAGVLALLLGAVLVALNVLRGRVAKQ